MLWGMKPATDKTPFGAPKKVTLEARPATHPAIVDKLIAAGLGLAYRDRDTTPEPVGDGVWWEEIEVPVTLGGTVSLDNISVDYNTIQGWMLSIWTNDDITNPADARAMAAAMVRGAALLEYLSDATK
jgi:hypothetical protein